MDKKLRTAVSVVVNDGRGRTLFALRNEKEKSFPLVWSLPSTFVREDESLQKAVKRIGLEKLGLELEPGEEINRGIIERNGFMLLMHDLKAEIVSGKPEIQKNDPYKKLKWEFADKQFKAQKKMGECCRLYKEYLKN